MAQRGKAALPCLVVLLLVSQYLVFFLKPQLLESANGRKIHQHPYKNAAAVMGKNFKVCPKYFLLTENKKVM